MDKKSLKVIRIVTINDGANGFFSDQIQKKQLTTYDVQLNLYNIMGYTYGNAFSVSMNSLGYDAREIVYDCEIMQKTWAQEHDVPWNEETWEKEILLNQIASYKPDIILFQGNDPVFSSETRYKWKEKFPFIQLLLLHKGNLSSSQSVKGFDVIFSAYPDLHTKFLSSNLPSYLLYHGFDHNRLLQLQKTSEQYEFTFTGSSGFGIGEHRTRYWALDKLFSDTSLMGWIQENENANPSQKINFFIYYHNLAQRFLWNVRRYGLKNSGSRTARYFLQSIYPHNQPQHDEISHLNKIKEPDIPISKRYPTKIHPPVHGIDMLNILYNSKISLQIGGDAQIYKQNGSMRQFDVTGAGSLLLMDHGDNVYELFIPEREIMTYSSIPECKEIAHYLLENKHERIKIAQAGQKRTLKEHTVLCRCREMDKLIQEKL
jgi:hypothetical protein